MKTLELELKKKIFIVDTTAPIEAIEIDGYEYKCKGSELTEEIASELVDEGSYFKTFKNYITNDNHKTNQLKFAKDSFVSAVESKGFYWLKNPIKYKKTDYEIYADKNQLCRYISKEETLWEEAEEKTFRNPLIFVKI